ncbi:DUF3168 domain-containing protein [Rouxiella badensis]|uniref:tail completion protein gp17 n=1 Tax=Rouxiella badensis TaxID=1646377 RepID=UPI001D141F22|nr:DUF3168 domain-containing protein [Rouxiella badensis]MCC3720526.1 DUF3168 domain-containing protein [Rouxiella badensis]MCC3730365.1 DUF3168 domain-containing protein [Rouxiella badensis]MCC3742184.1 DUF3168 domain-containing protein [Rouxiella badensis]
MIPPLYSVCATSQAVMEVLGDDVRLYPFGESADDVIYPYAVWQNIGGAAAMFLGNRPDVDSFSIQIDVYADTPVQVLAVTKALRDAIEPHAYVTRWGNQDRDPDTKRYHYSFDIDWIVKR